MMRKLIGLTMVLLSLIIRLHAQKLTSYQIPSVVKSAFAKRHPAINKVKWEMEKNDYEAGFTLNRQKISEAYTVNGVLLETELQITFAALPAAVQAKLKGLKISEAAKISKSNGAVIYEAEVKGKDLLFDANGNIIKP